MKVAIIGGGAAGFFSAISVLERYPEARVVILERSSRVLAKVGLSGGGRCNVTNSCPSVSELCRAYPRGGSSLKKVFHEFNNRHAMEWFESRGVPLVVQEDGCVFPVSQSAQSIIDCLVHEARRLGVEIVTGCGACTLDYADGGWMVGVPGGSPGGSRDALPSAFPGVRGPFGRFDKVIVATGGSPQRSGLEWLARLGHTIEEPVPSLFSFQIPFDPVTRLMGVVAEHTRVSIRGTKCVAEGALLITHWGMSGPVILKLSSHGARVLSQMQYRCSVQVNWTGEPNQEVVQAQLESIMAEHPRKMLGNVRPFGVPERLWLFLLEKGGFSASKIWSELGKKGLYKLTDILTNDVYAVEGQSTYKDEFVTCGGVSLRDVDLSTMQSKICPGLYFAGEVLDIDAITGGYNLQAAWSTGYIAGKLQ